MKEYVVIGEFTYNKKKFELLLDDNYKYFFLEIKLSGEREYVEFSDYVKLATIFTRKPTNHLNAEGKRQWLKPKVWYKGVAVALSAALIMGLTGCADDLSLMGPSSDFTPFSYSDTMSYGDNEDDPYYYDDDEYSSSDVNNENATEAAIKEMINDVTTEEQDFHIETIDTLWDLTMVYDSSVLDDVLGYPKSSVTYDTIKQTIQNNEKIPPKFKSLYTLLADNLQKQYPDMDLRVWYENLKTMKIYEVDEMEMYMKAFSTDAFACYRLDENAIYTVEGYNYVPGTWEYQVIMHEMGHPIRSANFIKDGKEIRIQFESQSGFGVVVGESLNSLLTLRSYDKNEMDVAYQLQSNMIELMVDSMTNYTLQDFVEHNVTYFIQKLNEANGNEDGIRMLGLLDLQYKDYHDDEIKVDQSQFYPLYDYIADMFYNRFITSSMNYDQSKRVHDMFVLRLTYDVPEEYEIDVDHLNEHFEEYCQQRGIRAYKNSFTSFENAQINSFDEYQQEETEHVRRI